VEKYLNRLQRFGVRLGLRNVASFLNLLGNPQRKLSAIHIGGTNGKGSTAAFIASILRKAGYRVGLYTSPHIHDVRERIQINGNLISKDRFDNLIRQLRGFLESRRSAPPVTYFEFLTALSFQYFLEENIDIAVIEVGMGGRLDATNLIHPLVSVISTVSMDHEEYLGNTLVKIAREKAGIIQHGGILVTGVWQRDLQKMFGEICKRKKSQISHYAQDFYSRYRAGGICDYYGRTTILSGLSLCLRGRHQGRNVSLALATIEHLRERGFRAGDEAVLTGIKDVQWPCRLEVVREKPLVVLDGAHNAEGAHVLSIALKEEFLWKRLFLVFGVLSDKDYSGMLSWISPLADRVILTRPRSDRALSPKFILNALPHLSRKASIVSNPGDAVEEALDAARPDDCICVCGSLFTAAAARAVALTVQ